MIPSSIRFAAQGADRYVTGDVIPYDQRNEMFKRAFWDPQKEKLRDQFYFSETPPRETPGYRLADMALVNASWRLEREYALGVRGGRMGMYAWDWNGKFTYPHVPEGLKVDTNQPLKTTRAVKRAAKLFGADLTGVCELDRRWVYSNAFDITPGGGREYKIEIPPEFKFAIAIAVEGTMSLATAAKKALTASGQIRS